MKIIGQRKKGLTVLYGFVLFFSLILCAIGIAYSDMLFPAIMGLLIAGVAVVLLIGIYKTPEIAIALEGEDTLHLPGGVTVKTAELTDISYRNARSKGVRYKWGKVIIKTYSGTYTVNYLADCEDVAKELTRLMYEAKRM